MFELNFNTGDHDHKEYLLSINYHDHHHSQNNNNNNYNILLYHLIPLRLCGGNHMILETGYVTRYMKQLIKNINSVEQTWTPEALINNDMMHTKAESQHMVQFSSDSVKKREKKW